MDIYSILSGLANAYRDPEQGILSQDQLNAQLNATPLAQAMQTQQPQVPQAVKAKVPQKAKAKGTAFNPATDAGAYSGFDNPDNYGDGQQVFNPSTDAGAYAGFDNPDNYGNGQDPQTPLSQAMAPQASSMVPPQVPQQSPGLFARMNGRQDANSIYDGLIKGGAAMLGAKNLQQGLADGVSGFNDAYDARTDKDKAENTPKVTQLADGAFSSVQYPGKPPVIMKNEQVAAFINGQKEAATQATLAKIDYQAKVTAAATQGKEDRKIANDATEALQGTQASLTKIDQAIDIVSKQGKGSQVAGAVPGIAGFFGGDTASQNKFLSSLQVDARLAEAAYMKGAISDKEQAMLKEPVPSLTDDRETVWKPWLEQRKAALEKVAAFQASQAARGTPQAARSAATPQRPAASSGGVQNMDAVKAELLRRGIKL